MPEMIADTQEELVTIPGVEVFRAGAWNGDEYTTKDLDDMVAAFDKAGFRPPVKVGHTTDPAAPAAGWIANLRRAGEKLIADFVDVPRQVYDAIKRRSYGPVSAEVFWDLERGKDVFRRVLKAVALLGAEVPAVSDLRPAYDNLTLKFAEIRTYELDVPKAGPRQVRVALQEMRGLCPGCADKMTKLGFREVIFEATVDDAGKWYINLPEGTVAALCDRFGPAEGFRTRCMEHEVAQRVDDPGAFCNALKDACGLLSQRQEARKMAKRQKIYRIEERDGEFCLIGENDESLACYPTKEEAEAALREAAAKAKSKQYRIEERDGEFCVMGEDDTPVACYPTKEEAEAALKEAAAGEIQTAKLLAAEAKVRVMQEKITATEEAARQARIAEKVAKVQVPAYRPYVSAFYDIATTGAKVIKFSIDDKTQDTPSEEVVDRLVDSLNKQSAHLFAETSTSGKAAGEITDDPQAEADRRAKAYIEKNSLHPVRDYKKALAAVLAEDEALKTAYAGF